MLQLSLSWLGLGPVSASPWLLLQLVGATWLLSRILSWIYDFYDNCCRLRCFPQPPKRNWFWGHWDLILILCTWAEVSYHLGFPSWLFGRLWPCVSSNPDAPIL
uniref:Uncharacterized protein n=1 Tax=Sus scrofa TaxID=9823 RepID=A0A8D1HMU8_PIG